MYKRVLATVACLAMATVVTAQSTVTTSGGTTNTVPVFSGSATLGNSPITTSGKSLGIGTTSPSSTLDVYSAGNQFHAGPGGSVTGFFVNTTDTNFYRSAIVDNTNLIGGTGIALYIDNNADYLGISYDGFGNPYLVSTGANRDFSIRANGTGSILLSNNSVKLAGSGIWNSSGNVGIGTQNPGAKLEVSGNILLTSGSGASITFADGTAQTTAWTGVLCGGDYSEAVNAVGGRKIYSPGDVLVLSDGATAEVAKSAEPYSTMVAGIYATKPGVVGRRQSLAKGSDDVPMAMVGIVPTKVTTENGPIHRGDLLVTSSMPGYAMKGTDRSRLLGAVLGKAMGALDSGTGVIEVLVTLQ